MYFIKNNRINFLIVLFGILLTLFQLLYNRSLWVDEAMLALNIIKKTQK